MLRKSNVMSEKLGFLVLNACGTHENGAFSVLVIHYRKFNVFELRGGANVIQIERADWITGHDPVCVLEN